MEPISESNSVADILYNHKINDIDISIETKEEERVKEEKTFDHILTNNPNRYVLFPIQDNDIWNMYKKALDSFWVVQEIDCSKDIKDWNNKLNDDERYFLSMILAFFAASDGIVVENLAVRFMKDVQLAEARCFYGSQILIENIHSEMYSILIDTLIQDKDHQMKLFRAVDNFPCIAKKATWAKNYIVDKKSSFATRVIAFALVEGLFFSSAFASIFWVRKRGLLPGFCTANDFISKDESLHCEFAVLIYNKLQKKIQKKKVYEMVKEAVEIEKEFILEAIPCRMIGMNSTLMSQYIEFVADRLCLQLGYDKIYNTNNPFDFMELISVESKVNFFERTNSEYALANKTVEKDVFEFNANF